ncbi:putative bifunctional diguanylate cyclase/phosphodiesterase [Geodermatophilus sp. SYSU D00815]
MLGAVAVLVVHAVVHGSAAAAVLYLGVSWAAAALAWWGALRCRQPGTVAVAWGLTLSAAGDLTWQVIAWRGGSTDFSVADAAYVAAYFVLAAGLWRMAARSGRSRGDQVDGALDGAVVFVAGLLVVWQLSLAGTLADESVPLLTRLVWALYPAFDAALVGLVFRLVVTRRRGSRAALGVAAGALCWLGSDLAYALVDLGGVTVWSDTGWLLGAVLLAAAVWWAPGTGSAPAPDADPRAGTAGLGRLAVCLGGLLVPTVVDLVRGLDPSPLLRVPVLAGTALLAVLVFLRAARLLRAEAEARAEVRSRQRYSAALAAHSSDAVAVLGPDGQVVSDPASLAALLGEVPATGLSGGELLRRSGVDQEEARAAFARVLRAGPGVVVQAELRCRRDGGDRWLGVRLIDLRDDDDVRGIVLHATDITDRKRAEAALEHLAFHDPLTGLANRALLTDRVDRALRGPDPASVALVLVDLDGFKAVNDTLGHPVGDALLREVAARLTSAVRGGDLVARLGGDEFAVLVRLDGGDRSGQAAATAARVLELLRRPVVLDGQRVEISGSLGIAVGAPGATSDSLVGDADLAMYAAKVAGRDRCLVFDPALREGAHQRRLLEQGLRTALDDGELRLVYQPVVDLADERVVGVEALLRWHSPTLGDVPPDRFVPVAEELGLIDRIGAWVLAEACTAAAAWRRERPGGEFSVAVNVSPLQLTGPDLAGVVTRALADSGLPPSALVLEVTETALMSDPERAARCLSALRATGVRVALDDFGVGHSSLGYLRQFDVDVLKVDRSFVAEIGPDGALPAILRGMVDLGTALGLEVVAEGVEHESQRDALRTARCARAQGYLFARPLPSADVPRLLEAPVPAAG